MGNLRRTERSVVKEIYGVQFQDGRGAKDSELMLGFNETVDQWAVAMCVCRYGHVLRMALQFKVEGQRMKGSPKRT